MVFQRKHDPKTLTVVPADVISLSSVSGSQSRAGESVIGNDMSIEGQSITVRCKGSLRVNGVIAADLHCTELVVGEQAVVNGSIAADSVRVFVLPPSWSDLSRRLHARAQDSEDIIQLRLDRGKGEIAHWKDYDYVIVNKNFDRAYADLGHIYRAERLKPGRNPWLPEFVEGLAAEEG